MGNQSKDVAARCRQAAIEGMHRFAFENRIASPAVREELRDGAIYFIGTAADGREYVLGYEPDDGEVPSGEPFPAPPPRYQVAA